MSSGKTIGILVIVLMVGLGVWTFVRTDGFRNNDYRDLFEQFENGNQPETQQPQQNPVNDVLVVSAGDNSLYGLGALNSGDAEAIRAATRPAIVTAETGAQFSAAAEILLPGGQDFGFNGETHKGVFVLLGLRTSEGYGIEYKSVNKDDNNNLIIRVDLKEPGSFNFFQNRRVTSPYFVLAFPDDQWQPQGEEEIRVIDDDSGGLLVAQTWSAGLARQQTEQNSTPPDPPNRINQELLDRLRQRQTP